MKKRINIYMLAVAVLAVLLTALLSSISNVNMNYERILGNLKAEAVMITDISDLAEGDSYSGIIGSYFDVNSETFYDSESKTVYEDLASRKDISLAIELGEGTIISAGYEKDTSLVRYSYKINDTYILTLSQNTENLGFYLNNIAPMVCGIILIIVLLCVVLTKDLTVKIIKLIEKMADNVDYSVEPEYIELVPIANMLKEQHENILKSAKMRQEFTANVSHELKTPLTVISGYAELIENGMADYSSIVRFSKEIHRHSERLIFLINDIIKLSELDSDSIEVIYEKFDLSETVKVCRHILEENAKQHGVTLYIETQTAPVEGSRSMIEELLNNLVNNAISYNKVGGSVWIKFYNDNGRAVLSVKDNGIGIPKEYQERIFERFYRVDKSRSKQSGGTGLGLAIVKHIAASHNAKIYLFSEVGEGTEIKVNF